jgi:glycerophosphoryl diester phosphodiesterase
MHDERVARSTADGITDVEHVAAVGLATISDEEMRRRLVEAPSYTVALLRETPALLRPAADALRDPRPRSGRPIPDRPLRDPPGVRLSRGTAARGALRAPARSRTAHREHPMSALQTARVEGAGVTASPRREHNHMTGGRAPLVWIGHGGASALAPANSLRSFALAAELGVDVIEFDVRLARGRLLLAHTALDAWRPGCLELDAALRWLATEADDGLELVVDLKTRGTERAVVDALRRHRLLDRALLASQRPAILRRVQVLDPSARTAISVAGLASRVTQRWGDWRAEVLADLRAGRYSALMAHRGLVDASLVESVRATGAQLYAWTISRADDVGDLARLGVDGIVTSDPRLLTAA